MTRHASRGAVTTMKRSGIGAQAGRGRVDLRFAVDNDGELYILTKSDGMIRKVVGAKATTTPTSAANAPTPSAGQNVTSQPATTTLALAFSFSPFAPIGWPRIQKRQLQRMHQHLTPQRYVNCV